MTFEEQVAGMRDACDYCGGLVFKELAEDIAREADQRIAELEAQLELALGATDILKNRITILRRLTPIEPQPEWTALILLKDTYWCEQSFDGLIEQRDAPTPTSRPVLLDKWYWYQEGEKE